MLSSLRHRRMPGVTQASMSAATLTVMSPHGVIRLLSWASAYWGVARRCYDARAAWASVGVLSRSREEYNRRDTPRAWCPAACASGAARIMGDWASACVGLSRVDGLSTPTSSPLTALPALPRSFRAAGLELCKEHLWPIYHYTTSILPYRSQWKWV